MFWVHLYIFVAVDILSGTVNKFDLARKSFLHPFMDSHFSPKLSWWARLHHKNAYNIVSPVFFSVLQTHSWIYSVMWIILMVVMYYHFRDIDLAGVVDSGYMFLLIVAILAKPCNTTFNKKKTNTVLKRFHYNKIILKRLTLQSF